MAAPPNLAAIARLIGEPARATILSELLDGRALTATELATRAGVMPATASVHLARLVSGGLLAVEPQGRHRYFRLAGRDVARVLERLAGLVPAARIRPEPLDEIRFARSCYDHLAGWLGVALRDALLRRQLLRADGAEHRVTTRGGEWLASLGIDLEAVGESRRSFARSCLDWSERRPHLAGALGHALLLGLLERKWLAHRLDERTIDLTAAGRKGFAAELGISVPGAPLHQTG